MQHTHLKWILSQHKGSANKYAGWDSNGNPTELDAPESSGGGTPTSRTLTINGTTYDLSANRSWSVGDLLSSGSYSNPTWITSLAWSKISGTPTTRSGYGITDAEPTISSGTTSQYWRGDKTWQTIDHGSLSGLSNNDHAQYELAANKNIAGGYAGLTESTLVAAVQLGSGTPSDSNWLKGDRTWTAPTYSDVGAAPTTGSTFITTLGTITTGVWQGSIIGPGFLGSGTRDGTKFLRDDGTWQPETSYTIGTTAGTIAAGDDSRFTDARAPTGSAGGDLGGTYPNPSVDKIAGVTISGSPTGSGQSLLSTSSTTAIWATLGTLLLLKITTTPITDNPLPSDVQYIDSSYTGYEVYIDATVP